MSESSALQEQVASIGQESDTGVLLTLVETHVETVIQNNKQFDSVQYLSTSLSEHKIQPIMVNEKGLLFGPGPVAVTLFQNALKSLIDNDTRLAGKLILEVACQNGSSWFVYIYRNTH